MSEALANCRRMRPDELPQVLDWAAAEGWNPGLDDAAAFYATDPHGFFVAEAAGAAVAAISVVNHDPEVAFLGLYLCLPAHRRMGIGYRLWQHALAHAGERTVGLDGVAAQQANYARSGFWLAGATLRWQGKVPAAADHFIRCVEPGDHHAMAELDREANGYGRPKFLQAWLRDTATRRTLVLEESGTIAGFATIRRCRHGRKIGPLVAPDDQSAWRLVRAALAVLPGDLVVVDVPEVRGVFARRLAAAGFTEIFRTARMYRGTAPTASKRLHGVGTLELG